MESNFSSTLQRLMDEHNLKPTAVARISNVERQTVYNWLAGATPRREALALLCKHFDMTEAEIMYGRFSYDNARLVSVIELVEASSRKLDIQLTPTKKAKLITLLYEKYASGENPSKKDINDLVSLSA